ncbi:TetR/AcrR family transcriptional regulator [Nocardiopsis sp. NPDC050513]|uniref:TetR/AcrR family transcriptional regulator n=1 Tax=Nocardiopsis sp. NPDC050513 TaxID=3364338 RepID=UPI0037AA4043
MSTAERLIESTRELLWERGYVGTSPRAVLERAGAGQGSMYHHFRGKRELALAAIGRTAGELRDRAEEQFGGPGTALDRITAYMRRERDVLRGCPIGRLTQDPDVMADAELRAPVDDTLRWLRGRLAEVVAEGRDRGELDPATDPDPIAAALVAAMQGGYVLARAADSTEPFHQAVAGVLALLADRATPGSD